MQRVSREAPAHAETPRHRIRSGAGSLPRGGVSLALAPQAVSLASCAGGGMPRLELLPLVRLAVRLRCRCRGTTFPTHLVLGVWMRDLLGGSDDLEGLGQSARIGRLRAPVGEFGLGGQAP